MICTAIWGSTWLAITYQLGDVAPELSVAYRFGLAAIVLFAWCAATGRSLRFSAREHGYLAALGVMLMGLNYIGIYWSERFVTSGLVAVLFSTIVFMNPVGMRLAFGTPLSTRTLIAATMGVTERTVKVWRARPEVQAEILRVQEIQARTDWISVVPNGVRQYSTVTGTVG